MTGDIGSMYFTRTLEDWAKFEINNRTKYDASISSGLAIMANKKYISDNAQKKESKISIKFVRYDNRGNRSEIIEVMEKPSVIINQLPFPNQMASDEEKSSEKYGLTVWLRL